MKRSRLHEARELHGRSMGRALWTVEDFERAARGAHPDVRFVEVRGAANDPKMPVNVIEVCVRGRGVWLFRRRLPAEVVEAVRLRIVAEKPINVELRMI